MAIMNLSEQQWVTVQQKTFTKWLVDFMLASERAAVNSVVLYRLNTKIKARDIAVNDLVKDLSDGVRLQSGSNRSIGKTF